MSMYSRVSCPACKRIIDAAHKNEHGQPQPNETHQVGALAEIGIGGHALMFTSTGRTALCICDKRGS